MKYQLFPRLSDEDFAQLEASILASGVKVAVEYDEDGNILDGHHRVEICEKHGIADWPRVVRPGLSEAEKRGHVRELNFARRHLTTFQKREFIEAHIIEMTRLSSRAIGARLGVDHQTILYARRRLEAKGAIKVPDVILGRDGREQKSRRDPLPPSPKLSDGTRLDGLSFCDVELRIRECEADLAMLRRVQRYARPTDDSVIVRDAVPPSIINGEDAA